MTNYEKCRALELVAVDCEASIYENYSGRAMYGKNCIGISYQGYDYTEVIEFAIENGIKGAKVDSLGKGHIIYWPAITFEPKK